MSRGANRGAIKGAVSLGIIESCVVPRSAIFSDTLGGPVEKRDAGSWSSECGQLQYVELEVETRFRNILLSLSHIFSSTFIEYEYRGTTEEIAKETEDER